MLGLEGRRRMKDDGLGDQAARSSQAEREAPAQQSLWCSERLLLPKDRTMLLTSAVLTAR